MRVIGVVALLLPLSSAVLHAQQPTRVSTEARRAEAAQREFGAISVVVRGRCVDAANGAPLPGCRIELHAADGRGAGGFPAELLDPEVVTTGADGGFAVRVLAHDEHQVWFVASREGRVPRRENWRHLVAGDAVDLGDVRMLAGVPAVGRVIDTAGAPVPGVRLRIDGLPLTVERYEGKNSLARYAPIESCLCQTGVDGGFTTPHAVPAGEFTLQASIGPVLLEHRQIEIPESGPMTPVAIVVSLGPYVGGTVVDEAGEGVAGVELWCGSNGSVPSARTFEDGSFRLYRIDPGQESVPIHIGRTGPCEPREPLAPVAWGTRDLRIVVQRALTLDVLVTVAGTAQPVEEFAIRCYPVGDVWTNSERRLRLAGKHEGGRLHLDGVRRGAARLAIVPKDPTLGCVELPIFVERRTPLLRVEVPRMVPMMVQLFDMDGAPLAGAVVQVIEPGESEAHGHAFVDPRSDGSGLWSSDPATRFDTLLSRAKADEGGRCIVHGLDGREDLVLLVRRGDGVLLRETGVAFGREHGTREIRLRAK